MSTTIFTPVMFTQVQGKYTVSKRKWREKHREEIREKDRKYYLATKAERRFTQIRRRYGLTRDQYNEMAKGQSGACAICRHVPNGIGKLGTLHIDHDHATGRVRGLLCHRCNVGLANFREELGILQSAVDYMRG